MAVLDSSLHLVHFWRESIAFKGIRWPAGTLQGRNWGTFGQEISLKRCGGLCTGGMNDMREHVRWLVKIRVFGESLHGLGPCLLQAAVTVPRVCCSWVCLERRAAVVTELN